MTTSRALPVLRTPSTREAYEAVQRLLDLALPEDFFEVGAEVHALTLPEARRLLAAFPSARLSSGDPHRRSAGEGVRDALLAGAADATALLPVMLHLDAEPVGSVEERFLDLVGAGSGSIDWDGFSWPGVPELGLGTSGRDAAVQISLNSSDVLQERPATDHTVFVHFRAGELTRAEWLARKAGLHAIGPDEEGW